MTKDTKKKRILQWAEEAWRRELAGALRQLDSGFQEWRSGNISEFALSGAIHEFHDGANRDLFKRYTYMKPAQAVASAVADGLLTKEEIGDDLVAELKQSIRWFEELRSE